MPFTQNCTFNEPGESESIALSFPYFFREGHLGSAHHDHAPGRPGITFRRHPDDFQAQEIGLQGHTVFQWDVEPFVPYHVRVPSSFFCQVLGSRVDTCEDSVVPTGHTRVLAWWVDAFRTVND